MLARQRPGGWFGAESFDVARLSDRETKMLWGNGRLLVGLLAWHRLTGRDRGSRRTIWVSRALVPLHERAPDHPLRTVHAVERRDAAQLTAAQREDLERWRGEA